MDKNVIKQTKDVEKNKDKTPLCLHAYVQQEACAVLLRCRFGLGQGRIEEFRSADSSALLLCYRVVTTVISLMDVQTCGLQADMLLCNS